MSVVLRIAGLTLTEALRRRTVLGAILLGGLVLLCSLLYSIIRLRMEQNLHDGFWSGKEFEFEITRARTMILLMCLYLIRILALLFAIMLASGAISGEMEQGLLTVILTKPIARWKILLGKWIGLNLVCIASIALWIIGSWLSLVIQLRESLLPYLQTFPYIILYAMLACTLTLLCSVYFPRPLTTSLGMMIAIISLSDGILNALAEEFESVYLRNLADIAGLLMPQGYIAMRIQQTLQSIIPENPLDTPFSSSWLLYLWGRDNLRFPYLDLCYVFIYIIALLFVSIRAFERREAV